MKYALKIAYDGVGFSGFQRQQSKNQGPTVQGKIERALSSLFGEPIAVAGAGRTDAGVHAVGQVVGFTHPRPWLPRDLGRGLQGVLRGPIAVLAAARLPEESEFHPRHSALSRSYRYLIAPGCSPEAALMLRHHAWCLEGPLDLDRIQAAAAPLEGEHDFTTFAFRSQALPHCRRELRRVEAVRWGQSSAGSSELLAIELEANGFLRRMVRYLVAALVRVGSGSWEPEEVVTLLQARNNGLAPHPAPPHGLYFRKVEYPEDPFSEARPESEVWLARQHEKTKWR